MLRRILLCAALVVLAQAKIGFFQPPHEDASFENRELLGEDPLILTGMAPEAARAASRVRGAGLDTLSASYAGFFTTQDSTNNTMFFWYFEPIAPVNGKDEAELLIWLQGGPGGSSNFALFSEMGPYTLERNGTSYVPVPRPVTWNDKYAMLFIDNPVGAGFSYTDSDAGYCTNTKECVSRNLYSLMQQFYRVFPEKLQAKLFVTGESYGGHYVPGMAHYIHEQNIKIEQGVSDNIKIPLAGIAVGDGWIDPVNMMDAYADMMFGQGLVSIEQREVIRSYTSKSSALIRAERFLDAFNVWDEMLNGDVFPYGNLFHNLTGLNDYDNYMNTNAPESFNYYVPFLNQKEVRRAIHVGDAPFPSDPTQCEHHLLSDFMVSLRTELATLMDHYRVLLYSGQLDVIIGTALTESFLPFIEWKGKSELQSAVRDVWRIHDNDAEVAGYVRQANKGQFTFTVIRAAGHIAPYDQPERCRDMIERFVQNKPYRNLPNPQ